MPQDVESSALSRRAFVGKVATGAAGAAVALSATVASARPTTTTGNQERHVDEISKVDEPIEAATNLGGEEEGWEQASEIAEQPWQLLHPLREGSDVVAGWQVSGLTGIVHGSCVVTLRNGSGREHRVHVCRNGGEPQGLVYTDKVDLVAMNGGRGDLPTEESFGQAVAALAHVIASNEGSQPAIVASLMTQTDRVDSLAEGAKLR